MSTIVHERPGIYSSYDTSTVITGAATAKTVGLAARAETGTVGTAVTVTGYTACATLFGESGNLSALAQLLFANGVTSVVCVRVADEDEEANTATAYQAAFEALAAVEDVQIVICDSAETLVHQALRNSIQSASENRRERIAIVGGSGEDVQALITHAAEINSERVVLVGPDALDSQGNTLPGVYAAAALAGAVAVTADPAAPINGVSLYGLGGLSTAYSDSDIDSLVQGGVTPLESTGGILSPVRGITTRTKTGDVFDATWRELTTILIVDDVIPAVRSALRSKFVRTKNTAQNRSAIRTQVIVELEKKLSSQIIESYGEVTVEVSDDDPTVCLVEFAFAVAHGLNQIYLTAHITV